MLNFFKFLIFFPNQEIIILKNKNLTKNYFNILKILFLKKQNKYDKIIIFRDLIYKSLSILYLIPAFILRLLNYKLVASDSKSIGTYSEELEYILSKNTHSKLILLEPKSYCANKYFANFFYKNKFIIIRSNILSALFIPFTYIKFFSISPYSNVKNLIFQKQYYYKNNNKKFYFDHELLFSGRLSAKKKNIHLNLLDNKKDHIKKKCYLHIRDEQNITLRNSNIKNYLEAINLLIKNNFEIYYFSNKDPGINLKEFKFFNLKLDENKKYQIKLAPVIDLYLGQISGPFHLFHSLETDMVLTDNIVFNHLISNKNVISLFKKYIKNNKILNIQEIFRMNLECIWDSKILVNKNIITEDNSPDEILNACSEYLKNNFEINKIDFHPEINNFKNFYLINFMSKYFKNKTKCF